MSFLPLLFIKISVNKILFPTIFMYRTLCTNLKNCIWYYLSVCLQDWRTLEIGVFKFVVSYIFSNIPAIYLYVYQYVIFFYYFHLSWWRYNIALECHDFFYCSDFTWYNLVLLWENLNLLFKIYCYLVT